MPANYTYHFMIEIIATSHFMITTYLSKMPGVIMICSGQSTVHVIFSAVQPLSLLFNWLSLPSNVAEEPLPEST